MKFRVGNTALVRRIRFESPSTILAEASKTTAYDVLFVTLVRLNSKITKYYRGVDCEGSELLPPLRRHAMPILKVWSMDHNEKKTISLEEFTIEALLRRANEKGLKGSKVFLNDGTEVDDDEAIIVYKESPFLIGDEYRNENTARRHSADSDSTATVYSSIPSPSTSTISSNSNSRVNTAFIIPYDKIPNSILAKLNEDSPISNSNLNVLVRIVTQELIYDNPHPTRSLYRVIARELCDRYPCLYDRDEDTKELIGSGYNTVFKKIEERIHYIQRPNKKPGHETVSMKKRKIIRNLSAGCKEWEPTIPEEETLESLREKQLWLATNSTIKERDEVRLQNFMDDTYSYLRQFLNTSPTISAVVAEWPVLVEPKYMLQHFDKLCCVNSSECMKTCLEKLKIAVAKINIILKTTTAEADVDDDLLKFMILVGKYFKEEFDTVLVQNHQEVTRSEVCDLPKTPSPSIIAVSIGDNDKIYYLVVESRVISEVSSVCDALKILIAAYYVFNLAYPPEGQCCLEFIQRYIFKINPTEGTKVTKTTKQIRGNILSKVLSLITKLRKD